MVFGLSFFGKKSAKASVPVASPQLPERSCVVIRDAAVTLVPSSPNPLLHQQSAFEAPVARGGPIFQAFVDQTLTEIPLVLAAQLKSLTSLEEQRAKSSRSGYTQHTPAQTTTRTGPSSDSSESYVNIDSEMADNSDIADARLARLTSDEIVRPKTDQDEDAVVLQQIVTDLRLEELLSLHVGMSQGQTTNLQNRRCSHTVSTKKASLLVRRTEFGGWSTEYIVETHHPEPYLAAVG